MSTAPTAVSAAANPTTPLRRQPPSPGQVFLSIPQVCQRYAIHRATVYRWMSDRGFPQPVQFSPSCARVPLAEVEKWEASVANQQAGG